jgi:hypothetical protein
VLDDDLREQDEDGRIPAAAERADVRSARYVAWLAWRRLRRRDSGALTTALGLAVAAAMLAAVAAGATIAADRATARSIEEISVTARSVRAVWFGVPEGSNERLGALDRDVEDALGGLSLGKPTPILLVRQTTVAGAFVGIAAVDGLAGHVRLRSGRLPRACMAARCEVLRLRGTGRLPNAPGLHLVPVGTATLDSAGLFGDFLASADQDDQAGLADRFRDEARYHEPPPPPLVVADGRAAIAASPLIANKYRSYAWVWPVSPGHPRLWQVDGLVDDVERARTDLATRSSGFAVDAPQEELRAAERSAAVSRTRLLLVGGVGAALLLAFTALAARGLKRDLEEARRRLTWFGARRSQLALLTGVESCATAFAGVLAGWVAGCAAGAAAASLAGAPSLAVLRESSLAPGGFALAAGLALVSAALIAVVVALPEREARMGLAELAAAVALVVVAVALLGGAADEDRLANGQGSAALLLLVPGLVAFAAAVLAARLLPPVAGLAARAKRLPLSGRLAALGLARGSGAAVATVGFLTIAFSLALLAEAYRATLVRSEREQAAFQVPLDAVVREDLTNLVAVSAVAPLDRFRQLAGPGGDAYPVLRASSSAVRAERITGVTALGLDQAPIEKLTLWRGDWSAGRGRADVAALVKPHEDMHLRTLPLSGDSLAFRAGRGLVSLAAIVRTEAGEFRRVELGAAVPARPSTLSARVPEGSELVRLMVVPPPRLIEGGASAGHALRGSIRLGGPVARRMGSWIGADGVQASATTTGLELRFALTPQRLAYVRERQPTDSAPPSVLVTPRLAELAGGVGGTLPLRIGGAPVLVRVAGVVDRFPTTTGEVVVGDRTALRTAIDTASPGAAPENEVWMKTANEASLASALARPPYRALDTVTRAELEAEARDDPLARGTLIALAASALVALVLAAVGLALAVRADLRDDRGESYDLEAQGATPSFLRSVVRARALVLSALGLAAGALTGIALLGLVTRVVTVTARGLAAEPPLVADADPLVAVIGIVAYLVLAALLVGSATRRAFGGARGPSYRRTDES